MVKMLVEEDPDINWRKRKNRAFYGLMFRQSHVPQSV